MKLPRSLLLAVRGPALAIAVVGCASAEAAIVPAPPPIDHEAAMIITPSPVSYDPREEAERLERVDRTLAAADVRRERRSDAQRRDRLRSQVAVHAYTYTMIGCGRG